MYTYFMDDYIAESGGFEKKEKHKVAGWKLNHRAETVPTHSLLGLAP
jgi:hypothetical protein